MRSLARSHRSESAYLSDISPCSRDCHATRDGASIASPRTVADDAKRLVYILRSVTYQDRRYVGVTADVPARLRAHNGGQNPSTAPWKPWAVDVCIEFGSERMAVRFEKYLKSGSGHEFAKRHFEDRL